MARIPPSPRSSLVALVTALLSLPAASACAPGADEEDARRFDASMTTDAQLAPSDGGVADSPNRDFDAARADGPVDAGPPGVCGNGRLERDEVCDDGNTDGGDGCDGSCRPERAYVCDGAPSRCYLDCDSLYDGELADFAVPAERRFSRLYPPGWRDSEIPGEMRVQDFSYAGYHNGEVEPALDPKWPRFSIADFADRRDPDDDYAEAFQAAIDAASEAAPAIVEIPSGTYRIDQPLAVTTSGVVIQGAGPEATRLWFTRDGLSHSAHVRFVGNVRPGETHEVMEPTAVRQRYVRIDASAELEPGDDVEIGWEITDAFVSDHSMTGTWEAHNGRWMPFFRRRVLCQEIDEDGSKRVYLDVPLRYPIDLRDSPALRTTPSLLHEVGIEDLSVANATDYDVATDENQVHAIELFGVADGWVRNVSSFVSPGAPRSGTGSGRHFRSSGLLIRASVRVSVDRVHFAWPQHRGGGGNGYLFEVRQSNEILFRESSARQARHGFIQNWEFGTSGVVWLRVRSYEGTAENWILRVPGCSEFHHSLSMANLIDNSQIDDCWQALNRGSESSGAGHTATETVFWRPHGEGNIRSYQYGRGYVTGADLEVRVDGAAATRSGASPEDLHEDISREALFPDSLYEHQLSRRLARNPPLW